MTAVLIEPKDIPLDAIIACMELRQRYWPAAERIRSKDMKTRWKALREFYKIVMPEILKAPANQWAIDPYAADWCSIMTPIEFGIWQDIRAIGAVFYPQFPIGRYFADFANPVAKVVIECDGKAFHQDVDKDQERQWAIEDEGYEVYRFTGRQCLEPSMIEGDDGYQVPNEECTEGAMREICIEHGIILRGPRDDCSL